MKTRPYIKEKESEAHQTLHKPYWMIEDGEKHLKNFEKI